MEIKEYLVTFMVKENNGYDSINFDYTIEAMTKAQAIGMAFQIFFSDHNGKLIDDYIVQVLVDGKYEYA